MLGPRRQQFSGLNTEYPSETIDHIDGRPVLAALQRADIGAMDVGTMRELFLRKAFGVP